MKFGECFIFNTIGSPHTGYKYNIGSEKNRKSVEVRVILLKNVEPKETIVTTPIDIKSLLPSDNFPIGYL